MIKYLKYKILKRIDLLVDRLLNRNRQIKKYNSLVYLLYEGTKSNSKISEKAKICSSYYISDSAIGDYSYVAGGSRLSKVTIGKFCSIGPNLLAGYGIHPLDGISTSPMFYSTLRQNGITLSLNDKVIERKPIYIGNDVFIGMNVTVLDGVRIGDGAVIGAGAVVSKDIPPYAIAVGCPIKIIRYRFDEDLIKELQKIQWWNWPLDKLTMIEKEFFDINGFINKAKSFY